VCVRVRVRAQSTECVGKEPQADASATRLGSTSSREVCQSLKRSHQSSTNCRQLHHGVTHTPPGQTHAAPPELVIGRSPAPPAPGCPSAPTSGCRPAAAGCQRASRTRHGLNVRDVCVWRGGERSGFRVSACGGSSSGAHPARYRHIAAARSAASVDAQPQQTTAAVANQTHI